MKLPGATLALSREVCEALRVIELDSISRLAFKCKWRRWRYDELASLAGCEEDWMYPGRIRVLLTGGEARAWMRDHFRLWWAGDDEWKAGLLFTAEPLTGLGWDRRRIAVRTMRDAEYLAGASRAAAHIQPIYTPVFLQVERAADRMVSAIVRLSAAKGL